MLFYHTRHVLEKWRQRNNNAENSDDIDEDDSEEEMDWINQNEEQNEEVI